jgi:hypothetical protein
MHCPNCGTLAATEQKYCRSCGLELQAVQQLVVRQLSGLKPRQSQAAQVARFAWLMFSGVFVMFVGAGLLAMEKRFGWGASAGLLGLFLTIGGPLLALYAVLAPMLHQPKLPLSTPPETSLPTAETTSKLALTVGAEPVNSIVEHTTRTLERVAAKSGDLA